MMFAELYLRVPSGKHVGKPLRLAKFQEAFLYSVFDNPHNTRTAILSVARRNSKSFLTAVILLAYIIGPLAEANITVASAANSRNQAALIYKFINDMVTMSPRIQKLVRLQPSHRSCIGLAKNTTYLSMSADAKTGFGHSFKVVVLDESGQIKGPDSSYVSMLRTSQGSYEDSLFITISTQAAADADFLSVLIDDATRTQDPKTVCHLYTTPESYDLLDEEGWAYSNPAIGNFRSLTDLEEQLRQASRLSALSANAQNLLLNRRIAQDKLWLSPAVWKNCSDEPELSVFQNSIVAAGIDLSTRTDLTAVVLAAMDEFSVVHLLPFVFTPASTLEERAARDRAPYSAWVDSGHLIPVPGPTLSYEWIAEYLTVKFPELGVFVHKICFDRWRITDFRNACQSQGFGLESEWLSVGQGYRDMSPRIEAFETLLLEERIRHGSHPLLNFAAAGALAVKDPAGNRKLEKAKSTNRIDPIIAALMAVYAVTEGNTVEYFDTAAIIG